MVYSYKELKKIYKTSYSIQKALKNHDIYKISKGLYSENRNVDSMVIYSKKYPKSIITMDSAFYYYDLTDVIPTKTYIATPMHSYVIPDDNIFQIFVDDKILDVGKTKIKIENQDVYIYDKERLLVELIRKRKKIPFDYYKEIIYNYRNIADELDMRKIEKYSSFFKNEVDILDALLREVF